MALLDRLDEDTVRKLYISDKLTVKAIANIYGVGSTTVTRRLEELGIPRRQGHPVPDRDVLYNLYWDESLSQKAIAKRFGVGSTSVCRWMKKLNIPQRQLNPNMYKDWADAPHRDPELLRRLYWDEKLNTVQIAEQLGVSGSLIGQQMQRYGIPVRDQALATHLVIGNSVELSDEAISFLQGELLGDGSLVMNKSISASYFHGTSRRGYLVWLREQFLGFGLEPAGHIREYLRQHDTGTISYIYSFSTRSYPELGELRHKWYPGDKKSPPRDLVLDGLSLRQWFIGDGNYRERHKSKQLEREVRISNFAFTDDDRLFLQKLMLNLGIGTTINKDGFRVRKSYVDKFFQVIGPCPVPDIYGYKWPSAEITHEQLGLL